jgi:hypothetical protein
MFSNKLVDDKKWFEVFRQHFVENKVLIILHLSEYLNTEINLIKQIKGKIKEYLEKNTIYNEEVFDFQMLEIALFKNTILQRTNSSTGQEYSDYLFAYNLFKATVYKPNEGDIYIDNCFQIILSGHERKYFNRDPAHMAFQTQVLDFLGD